MRENRRLIAEAVLTKTIDEFFSLPPDKQNEFLDRQIPVCRSGASIYVCELRSHRTLWGETGCITMHRWVVTVTVPRSQCRGTAGKRYGSVVRPGNLQIVIGWLITRAVPVNTCWCECRTKRCTEVADRLFPDGNIYLPRHR